MWPEPNRAQTSLIFVLVEGIYGFVDTFPLPGEEQTGSLVPTINSENSIGIYVAMILKHRIQITGIQIKSE